MSITHDDEEASRHSPKRKRSGSPNGLPQHDGAPDAALRYGYDEELPSELHSPAEHEEDGVAAKRQKLERPKRLNYKPYMTLRGHKRGVAAVKYSPDGRWIASCCRTPLEDGWLGTYLLTGTCSGGCNDQDLGRGLWCSLTDP